MSSLVQMKPCSLSWTLNLKTFAFIFDAACFFLALFQVIQCLEMYFEYRTLSRITQNMEICQPTPAVAFCVRYLDIIDVQGLKRDFGVNVKRTNKYEEISQEMGKLTVKQILDYTPSINESMKECVIRDEYGFKMIYPSVKVCRESFDVFKYYMQEFVCYQYQFKQNIINSRFNFKRTADSLNDKSVIYKIQFTNSFNPSHLYTIIVFSVAEDDYPFPAASRNWAPVSDRLEDFEKIVIKNNKFTASYELNKFDKLPPPYDTACNTENTHNQCYSTCLMKKLTEKLKKVPFSEIISDPIDLKHVHELDLVNDETKAFLNNSEFFCNKLCKNADCNFDFSVTHIKEEHDFWRRGSIYSPNIIIHVKVPDFPTMKVKHRPKLLLTEFLIYLLNCIGLYLGISILSLNPFRLWMKKMGRRTVTRNHERRHVTHLPPLKRSNVLPSR